MLCWIFSSYLSSLQCHMIVQKSLWFGAQETFLIIINVNSCASLSNSVYLKYKSIFTWNINLEPKTLNCSVFTLNQRKWIQVCRKVGFLKTKTKFWISRCPLVRVTNASMHGRRQMIQYFLESLWEHSWKFSSSQYLIKGNNCCQEALLLCLKLFWWHGPL